MCDPYISIILPIRNEEDYILSTIEAIISQNYNSEKMEIIICDGSSDDNTMNIVKDIASKNSKIKIINNYNKIVSTGFNLGLNQAKGNIIIRIDGHTKISSDYISACVELLQSESADIVGGCIKTVSYGIYGEAIAIAQSSFFGVGGVEFRNVKNGKPRYVNTLAFGAHRREIFNEIGGYDEDMVCNQDDEFNYRAIQLGKKILMDPALQTVYYSRSNFKKLFRQYFNYGFYKVRGIQKRKQIISIRHLIPSLFICSLFCTFSIGLVLKNIWIFILLLIVYFFINIFMSIILSPGILLIPLISFSFINLHISYGLGFIYGLFKFSDKWKNNLVEDNHFNRKEFISNSEFIIK